MKVKNIIFEDFVNYKKPSMVIANSYCTFKCDKEAGCQVCQNSDLALAPAIEIDNKEIVERYYNNPITEAVIFSGLEPFDTFWDMRNLMLKFTATAFLKHYDVPVFVIYTGYYPDEIKHLLLILQDTFYGYDIILKFGRFIPDRPSKFDELLGVSLASDNQFAMRLEEAI